MTGELEKGLTLGFFSIDKSSEKFYLSGKFRMENDRPIPLVAEGSLHPKKRGKGPTN
jgi:hypothetical protein